MAIENFDEVKTYFETNKDSDDVKAFVSGLNPVTVDRIKSLVSEDKDIKGFMDSEKDKHASKSLETWKQNNLEKVLEEKIKERFPQADPKDVELNKLKAEFEAMKQESVRKELTNKALKFAQEKKLPSDLIDFVVADDEESTNKNLEKLTAIFSSHDEEIKKQFASDNSYTPPNNKGNVGGDEKIREQIKKFMG